MTEILELEKSVASFRNFCNKVYTLQSEHKNLFETVTMDDYILWYNKNSNNTIGLTQMERITNENAVPEKK